MLHYSTPRYPQSNKHAELTNKTLINMLKKKVGRVKTTWRRGCWKYSGIIDAHQRGPSETPCLP